MHKADEIIESIKKQASLYDSINVTNIDEYDDHREINGISLMHECFILKAIAYSSAYYSNNIRFIDVEILENNDYPGFSFSDKFCKYRQRIAREAGHPLGRISFKDRFFYEDDCVYSHKNYVKNIFNEINDFINKSNDLIEQRRLEKEKECQDEIARNNMKIEYELDKTDFILNGWCEDEDGNNIGVNYYMMTCRKITDNYVLPISYKVYQKNNKYSINFIYNSYYLKYSYKRQINQNALCEDSLRIDDTFIKQMLSESIAKYNLQIIEPLYSAGLQIQNIKKEDIAKTVECVATEFETRFNNIVKCALNAIGQ